MPGPETPTTTFVLGPDPRDHEPPCGGGPPRNEPPGGGPPGIAPPPPGGLCASAKGLDSSSASETAQMLAIDCLAFMDTTFRMRTGRSGAVSAFDGTIVRPLSGARNPQDVTPDVSPRRTVDLRQPAA
jgi:hypothetical protein